MHDLMMFVINNSLSRDVEGGVHAIEIMEEYDETRV